MAKIEWSPIVDGEEIYADRLTEIGAKIRRSLNTPSPQHNVADRAFGIQSCDTDTIEQTASNYTSSMTSLRTRNGATSGDLWPGNPRSGEDAENRDPLWKPVDMPGEGNQITIHGAGKYGWRFLLSATFDARIDLLGDDSNGILVMSEAHVTELYSFLKTQKETLYGHTPHTLLFMILVAVVIDPVTGARTKIPLPSTLRFIDSDTNTSNSSNTNSGWVSEGGGAKFPYDNRCQVLTNIRKNMPIRSYVTYSDLNMSAYKGQSPRESARYSKKSSGKSYKKQVEGFQLFACLKPCSGIWHGRGEGNFEAVATIREKSLDAIYFGGGTHSGSSSKLTLNYP